MNAVYFVAILLLLQFTIEHEEQAVSFDQLQQNTHPFPKILWTFWSQGYQHASLFTKLCINNLAHFAKLSGWQFRFLTSQNYTLALSPQNLNRMQKMIEQSKYNLEVMHFADVLRILLIYEHGGMWIDANSFLLGELNWINQLNFDPLVYNRLAQEPSVLTFTYNKKVGGNKSIIMDSNTNQSVYLFPGIQTWAFAAKSGCTFFKDLLDSMEGSLSLGYDVISAQNKKHDLKFDNENIPYFFIGSYLCQMVLQLKQQQLQQSQQTQLKTAVEYYGIWSIDAARSALMIPLIKQQFPVLIMQTLLKESLASWSQKYNMPAYFVKLTGQYYPFVNMGVKYSEAFFCLGVNMTIEPGSIYDQFLYTPSRQIQELSQFNLSTIPQADDCGLFDGYFESIRASMMLMSSVLIFLMIIINFICFRIISSRRQQLNETSPLQNEY